MALAADRGNPVVRRAMIEDAANIAHIHATAWRETYGRLLPADILAAMTVESRERAWRRIFADPAAFSDTETFLVAIEGAAAGFGACCRQRTDTLADDYPGEFAAIYVLAAYQGQGAGRVLMQAMARHLASAGLTRASLWVLQSNRDARRFYEFLGGIPCGEKREQRGTAILDEVAYGWPSLDVI